MLFKAEERSLWQRYLVHYKDIRELGCVWESGKREPVVYFVCSDLKDMFQAFVARLDGLTMLSEF